MILVGFSHGLRPSEVVAIKPDDIRDGYLTVQRRKGSNRTTQRLVEHPDPMLSEVPALIEWAAKSKMGLPIFGIKCRQFQNVVLKHGAPLGIPRHKLTPHKLKHTIAMLSINSAGIENVRQWLGHKSLNSTGEYLKVSDEAAGAAISRALID